MANDSSSKIIKNTHVHPYILYLKLATSSISQKVGFFNEIAKTFCKVHGSKKYAPH